MITIVHGGQTGVDRGAHEAARTVGWRITGYMPRDKRDERGAIPEDIARFLMAHDQAGYGPRTEANVASASAALIVVRDVADPHATPGTAMTIKMVGERRLPCMVVDPTTDPDRIVHWLCSDVLIPPVLTLPGFQLDPVPTQLLVAGPRESKWSGAQAETTAILRKIAGLLTNRRRPSSRASQ